MVVPEKMFVFLCSSTMKAGDRKLAHRIASRLEAIGIAAIGSLQNLSDQHIVSVHLQRPMLFINDCRSSCVKVFMHGFDENRFLFFNVSPFTSVIDFDIDHYINTEVIPAVNNKWGSIPTPVAAIHE